jgi:hypothetical protein
VARECPSKRAYVATDDGGYISTSNVEDDFKDQLVPNEDGLSLSMEDAGTSEFVLYNKYSMHRWKKLRSCSAITCSRFYL